MRTRGGWFWTGDLGYRDEEGTFYFAGRGTDWLRVDGENFAAGPVELILGRHPDVADSVVYAVPDPRTGDQVMAALELRSGATFDPGALRRVLAVPARPRTKWAPQYVRIVEDLPVTATGKIDRTPLRSERWRTSNAIGGGLVAT